MSANIRPLRNSNRTRKQKGQAMVETALTLAATLAIVLSVVDLGQVFMQLHYMHERARAGAAYAATHSWDATATKNWICYGSTTGSGSGLMGLSPSDINVERLGSTSDYTDRVKVTVTRTITFYSPWLPRTWTAPSAVATSPAESMGATQ